MLQHVLSKTKQMIKRAICMHWHFEIMTRAILGTYLKWKNISTKTKTKTKKKHCFFFVEPMVISFMKKSIVFSNHDALTVLT